MTTTTTINIILCGNFIPLLFFFVFSCEGGGGRGEIWLKRGGEEGEGWLMVTVAKEGNRRVYRAMRKYITKCLRQY